jgi:hypothetical protein
MGIKDLASSAVKHMGGRTGIGAMIGATMLPMITEHMMEKGPDAAGQAKIKDTIDRLAMQRAQEQGMPLDAARKQISDELEPAMTESMSSHAGPLAGLVSALVGAAAGGGIGFLTGGVGGAVAGAGSSLVGDGVKALTEESEVAGAVKPKLPTTAPGTGPGTAAPTNALPAEPIDTLKPGYANKTAADPNTNRSGVMATAPHADNTGDPLAAQDPTGHRLRELTAQKGGIQTTDKDVKQAEPVDMLTSLGYGQPSLQSRYATEWVNEPGQHQQGFAAGRGFTMSPDQGGNLGLDPETQNRLLVELMKGRMYNHEGG